MDFKIDKKRNKNVSKYKFDELDISLSYAKEASKEFKEFLKGIILFGSAARHLQKKSTSDSSEKDIDLLLVLDDINININRQIIEAYKIINQKLVAKISKRIHITTLKFTTFWDMVRNGDPVAVNILRDGVPIVDTGFFEPLQALLLRGQIRPSFESIWTYFNRAPESLNRGKEHIILGIVDLYWAVIDASHAILMKMDCVPTSPENIPDLLNEKLCKHNLCTPSQIDIVKKLYGLNKEIEHRKIESISGKEFDMYYNKAKQYVEKISSLINQQIDF